jgi:hypothetical protein
MEAEDVARHRRRRRSCHQELPSVRIAEFGSGSLLIAHEGRREDGRRKEESRSSKDGGQQDTRAQCLQEKRCDELQLAAAGTHVRTHTMYTHVYTYIYKYVCMYV